MDKIETNSGLESLSKWALEVRGCTLTSSFAGETSWWIWRGWGLRVEIRWVHHPHYSPLVQFCRSWRGSKSVVSTQIAIRFLCSAQISGDDPAIDAVLACCGDSDAFALAFRYLRKVARTTVLRKSLSRTCRLGAWVSWNITSLAKCSSDTWPGRKADSRCRVLRIRRSCTASCSCYGKMFSKSYPAILCLGSAFDALYTVMP